MLHPVDVRPWDDETLLLEYEKRMATLQMLTGWLYTSIVEHDVGVIAEIAKERPPHVGIERWRDEGVVPSTWTDLFYVVHDWVSSCRLEAKPHPKADIPAKVITCLRCAVACSTVSTSRG